MNEEPLEYNYVVYEPTSNELGIVLGVFVDVEQATIYIRAYYGTYEHEPSLCIKKVPVNDDTCVQRYIQPKKIYMMLVVCCPRHTSDGVKIGGVV